MANKAPNDPLAKECYDRYKDLAGTRDSQFLPGWQDLSNYLLPQVSNINTQKLAGTISGWTDRIYDTTAVQAAQTCRSGQRNWLTPSSEPWAAFEPPESLSVEGREEEKDEAAQWLSKATDIIMRELARSNFYARVNEDYLQITVFGTGMMFVEEGKKTLFNFRQFKAWKITIEEDDEGVVDSVHREFALTTRQAVQQFGIGNVGPKIQQAFAVPDQLSKKWGFLHACFPREDSKRVQGKMDAVNKPVASVYICVDDMMCVQVGGYDEMPYLCSRFDRWGTETCWGYSPAYLALPDTRQINYVSQYRDALAELKAYPRFLYPDNLEGDVDLRAGGITTFDSANPEAMPKEWMTLGDDKSAEENMLRKETAINRAFYVNMFTMLEQLADKKMTAYEIAQRLGEKLEQFTPVFDRRVGEFLNPLLKRLFGIAYRAGKLGPAPASMLIAAGNGKTELAMPEIAITSRIAMALKALQNQGIINTLTVLQPIASMQPDILDNFDTDAMARELARNYSVPPDMIRSLKAMAAIRTRRQQQQQAQLAAQLAGELTSSAKDLSGAPPEIKDAVVSQFAGAA